MRHSPENLPPDIGKEASFAIPEKAEVTQLETVGNRFQKLEQLAAQIYRREGNDILIAGTRFRAEGINNELLDRINELEKSTKAILKKTARFAYKTARNLALAGVLVTGYVAVDLDRQEGFSHKEEAKQELIIDGIPSDQRYSAYKPGVSEILYRGVSPLGYQTDSHTDNGFMGGFLTYLSEKGVPSTAAIQQFVPNLIYGREYRAKKYKENNTELDQKHRAIAGGAKELTPEQKEQVERLWQEYEVKMHNEILGSPYDLNPPINPEENKALDDAWRLYLGLPQQYKSFWISDYKPEKSQEDKYYYKINNYWEVFLSQDLEVDDNFLDLDDMAKLSREQRNEFHSLCGKASGLKGRVELIQKYGRDNKIQLQDTQIGEDGGDVMFHYTVSLGHDEKGYYISYYDKWDLASALADNPITKGVGKAIEIYDRLYYNPTTYEVIQNR